MQVIVWGDIFAVVDDGRAQPREYEALGVLLSEQAAQYPEGIGCLAIIPANASPPSDAARAALNRALAEATGVLRCMCWLVEGTGFQAAMVQAILTGLRFMTRHAYATHVSTDMHEAIAWMQRELPNNAISRARVTDVCAELERRRRGH